MPFNDDWDIAKAYVAKNQFLVYDKDVAEKVQVTGQQILRDLLSRLASDDPINQDEMGGCVWCRKRPPGDEYGWSGRYLTDHRPDCPWVEARKILGDKLSESRET